MSLDDCDPVFATKLAYLTAGGSALIYAIDDSRVLKEYLEAGLEQECRALDRLNPHPNIVRKFAVQDSGIVLERGVPLRTVLDGTRKSSLADRLQYAKQAAEGLNHIHKHEIFHADVGPHNMIIIGKRLVIIDFEGCSIDGEDREGSLYEWCSYRPLQDEKGRFRISTVTDIFAYGCTLYELMIGHQPHHDLLGHDDRAYLARERWSNSNYPNIANLPLNNIIMACWIGQFQSMPEVLDALHSQMMSEIRHDPLSLDTRESWYERYLKVKRQFQFILLKL